MKLVHLSDLHLGKRLYETSLIEDQKAILNQIIDITDEENPDAVIVAGDVYDKSVPSAEAVALFDDFLVCLSQRHIQTFIISGNHDSPERIAFGSKIMDASGIHLSPVYGGKITPVTLSDEYGNVNFYMLPFVKPSHVRRFFDQVAVETYTDAVRVAVENMNIDTAKRNVLITHQFVTGATRSESEETVGGTDNVDASVLKDFDYVALGHLHSPQFCGNERIRYSGTPLKYSFAECDDEKSVTVVTLSEKASDISVKTIALRPLRDMKKIRGKFDELTLNAKPFDDYVQITLTDEDDIPDAMSRLQSLYKNALELRYDNARTRADLSVSGAEEAERKSTLELFAEFFKNRNNAEMTEEQNDYMRNLIESVEEDEK